jgi:DNA-binding NtrC family response regulator
VNTPQSLHIVLVDDEPIVRQTLGDYLRELGHRVDEARDGPAAVRSIEACDHDLALVDVRMPGMDGFDLLPKAEGLRADMPVVMITGHADMEMAIQALRLGAADFLPKPVKLEELDAVLEKCLRLRGLRRDRRRLREAIRGIQGPRDVRPAEGSLVGISSAAQKVRQQIREVVEAACETILITGETGTGKEVTAREIHFQASSPGDPFIAVSCATLTESLLESELFGHVKGSFTGATEDRMGCFELADGSTLLLDEAGDLSLSAQAKILRVLETRTLRRVGGSKEITVNVRVIAATNSPLQQRVEAGSFRRDLFHRLNVYSIHLTPLRQRPEDILLLAEHFLARYASPRGLQLEFSPGARDKLLAYDFPGNARELRYLVERAAILCRSGQIRAEHLSLPETSVSSPRPESESPESAENQERARILSALEKAHWNRRDAAAILAVPYSTLRYKMQKLGITK